jgi:hypothetical protein
VQIPIAQNSKSRTMSTNETVLTPESLLQFFPFGKPAGRTLRLKFIPEEFALTGFARFQRQRLALWGNDAFDFLKIGEKRLVLHRE